MYPLIPSPEQEKTKKAHTVLSVTDSRCLFWLFHHVLYASELHTYMFILYLSLFKLVPPGIYAENY